MACEHLNFGATVSVGRISDEDGGRIKAYTADVQIRCADCGEAFIFLGMECGSAPNKPMVSVLGEEARLPIRPQSEANQPMPARKGAVGFRISGGPVRQ